MQRWYETGWRAIIAYTGRCCADILDAIEQGELRAHLCGGHLVAAHDDLDAWLVSLRVASRLAAEFGNDLVQLGANPNKTFAA